MSTKIRFNGHIGVFTDIPELLLLYIIDFLAYDFVSLVSFVKTCHPALVLVKEQVEKLKDLWITAGKISSTYREILYTSHFTEIVDASTLKSGPKMPSYIGTALVSNSVLTELILMENDIHDAGLKCISDALERNHSLKQTLKTLCLSDNEISDTGVQYLSSFLRTSKITCLDLGYNEITNEGAKTIVDSLKENTSLTDLWLHSNNISDEGTEKIAEMLRGNTSLNHLCLSLNHITNKGMKDLSRALLSNHTLTSVDLDGNDYDHEGAEAFARALKYTDSLTAFSLCSSMTISGLVKIQTALQVNTTITQLKLYTADNIDVFETIQCYADLLVQNTRFGTAKWSPVSPHGYFLIE